jgi:hypothetical protein
MNGLINFIFSFNHYIRWFVYKQINAVLLKRRAKWKHFYIEKCRRAFLYLTTAIQDVIQRCIFHLSRNKTTTGFWEDTCQIICLPDS